MKLDSTNMENPKTIVIEVFKIATPTVIAAIVIVIISRGISSKPIIPKIKKAAIKFGTTPIKDKTTFLKRIRNIKVIHAMTIPRVNI